jgi:hypothetical protein
LASTAGWEAALIGKPVYVLGETFYDRSEVATPVSDFRALKRALRTRPGSANPDTQTVERFIASMAEQSYPGNPFPYTDLYSERNRRRVAEAIAAELPGLPAGPA